MLGGKRNLWIGYCWLCRVRLKRGSVGIVVKYVDRWVEVYRRDGGMFGG
jgi:hypothetical protein